MSKQEITIGEAEDGKPLKVDLNRLLVSRALITSASGGGKSYLLRRIIEEVSATTQTFVIDPESEFASLRELRDMVLVGPDGDLPADPRTAALLCRRLMERNVSAVMDVGELTPTRRREFVAAFCGEMVNLPRSLWRPCFVVIDEVHELAPNTKDKEYVSAEAISLLFSKGRKRGYCPIVATQRLSNVSPNVTAEAKNRFIGQTAYDVDQKRAADFLGWGKDRWPDLRDLSPPGREGEFFAVGPALGVRGVVKFRGGVVRTRHPRAGEGAADPPKPSKAISAVLGELADLAKQADEEARTTAEQAELIAKLKSQVAGLKAAPASPAPVPNPEGRPSPARKPTPVAARVPDPKPHPNPKETPVQQTPPRLTPEELMRQFQQMLAGAAAAGKPPVATPAAAPMSAEEEALYQRFKARLLAEVPAIVAGGPVIITAPDKLRKDFQREEADRIVATARDLRPLEKRILKFVEGVKEPHTQKAIALRLGRATGGNSYNDLNKAVNALKALGFVEVHSRGVSNALRSKIAADLSSYETTGDEIEAVYQNVLHALATAAE